MKLPNTAQKFSCALLTLLATIVYAQAAPKISKPNLVVILCDDLGYETVACYGGTSYKTPNLDALAQSGVRFQNAYCTPLCSPSRVELMTGRYGFRTSWTNLIGRGGDEANDYFDPLKEKTFGHTLKNAGYATAIAGKWQLCDFLAHPNHLKECGFDESCMWSWVLGKKKTSRYWDPSIWQNGKLRPNTDAKFGDDLFSDFLIDFMKRHKDQPFFVYYPMALVHEPHVPTPDSKDGGFNKKGRDLENDAGTKKDKQQRAAKLFPGMMSYMDKTVGKVVAAIDQLGLRENTLIIFTGDNGTDRSVVSKLGDLTVRGGKGTMTEFGTHVPFIASWKGTIAPGQVKAELIDFSDVLPTLAEIAGAKLPENHVIDGHSLAAQLRGEKGNPRDWIFTQLGHDRLARGGNFMLHDDGTIFDVVKDPFEKQNLADNPDPAVTRAKKNLQAVLDRMK